MRTGGDTESSCIVSKSSPKSAIAHTLPRIILPERVIWASEDTGASDIFCIGPRIDRTVEDTGLGGIISKGAIISGNIVADLGIGTDSDTGLAEHISIGEDILGTEPNTPSRVVVCELSGQR